MTWLIVFLLIGLLGAVALLFAFFGKDDPSRRPGDLSPKMGGLLAAGVLLVLNLAWSGLFAIHLIDARDVGVVRTFGSIQGQIGEGLQFTWPWQTVEKWNIRTQVVEPDTRCANGTDRCMDAGSIDVQDVYISGALNISVSTTDVQDLARTIGPRYKETIVLNRLYQVVKEVTARHKAEDILAAREQIRADITARMKTELSAYSINVHDFLITNIGFTPSFTTAIEEKVVAEQQAAQERNRVEIARAQADQRIEAARGEAERLRVEAQGQADANRLISESLTPALIQFQAVQKLADNVQIALIPSGEGIIIDPATILTGLE